MTSNYIPFLRGSYPARPGNALTPLVDGVRAFTRIGQAVDAALASVWVTVTFLWPEFRMPDGRTFFELLQAAAARGVDVRIIYWRPDIVTGRHGETTFWGSPQHHDWLRATKSQLRIRWDRAELGFAQHQKSWLIDAGACSEVAFVGGMNLNPHTLALPGHAAPESYHDVYLELAGPCASDVHHNFVQRWNEASERMAPDGLWNGADLLPFPPKASAPRGKTLAQVQRTIRRGRYTETRAAPDGVAFPIADGEKSVLHQYLAAIAAARRTIYIENQYVESPEIVAALGAALERGVSVILVLPATPDYSSAQFSLSAPGRREFVAARNALGKHVRFLMAGLAVEEGGKRREVYVHSKLLLVDDCWASIGSGNMHFQSLHGSGEMNVGFFDPELVRALRCELFAEHIGEDTSSLRCEEAFIRFRTVARANAAGDAKLRGLAFAIDPALYGTSAANESSS